MIMERENNKKINTFKEIYKIQEFKSLIFRI